MNLDNQTDNSLNPAALQCNQGQSAGTLEGASCCKVTLQSDTGQMWGPT